ncbi:TPA: hypothetical protein MM130_000358 [Klebsiella quasipneumoniae subsp. similipneumoniae]|uniref:hypothetical protein n=1 Tax=Klebsiella oxytoca TaxID=571 RepID=UPI002247D4BC|nr:hypothetical protein [Klebsiella oxytoca]MCW9608699.1 hypothetical protein [Klebsiella oxytoca]MCW9676582.1 hypothetical protein [Klebsiella oxytoca]HBZ7523804.1 hypothetical protein [Klebsiella quasipneumoniae subsp. similipneumoniae]HBZ8083593.1 hypothetical protein [Klebsiella quasipneumoniae subsp. similipneumoniae]
MGLFKKIKKAVKKAVKQVTKPVEEVAKGAVGLVAGGNDGVTVIEKETPAATVSAPTPAVAIDAPSQDDIESEDDATTESAKRKIAASGKRSLSIARSSGTGINI